MTSTARPFPSQFTKTRKKTGTNTCASISGIPPTRRIKCSPWSLRLTVPKLRCCLANKTSIKFLYSTHSNTREFSAKAMAMKTGWTWGSIYGYFLQTLWNMSLQTTITSGCLRPMPSWTKISSPTWTLSAKPRSKPNNLQEQIAAIHLTRVEYWEVAWTSLIPITWAIAWRSSPAIVIW